MKILQISTYDRAGGAEKVAFDLQHAYRELGHDVRMLVRHKKTADPTVIEADPYAQTAPWGATAAQLDAWIAHQQRFRGQYRARDWLRRTTWPQRWIDRLQGTEDFGYPYAYHLLDQDWKPDVIHAHNLHGDYFDLRALATLSRQVPLVWTLHDTWAMTGHCAYFIDCPRWETGCGQCPDLQRPPAIRRDRTAENWQRKQAIYAQSRLAVATPSQWLMNVVERSMLRPWQKQVIPYGIDQRIYSPGEQQAARAALGLPQNAFICMFIAYSVSSTNIYKDVTTVDRAVRKVMDQAPKKELLFLCVGAGGDAPADDRIRYTGYLSDPTQVALYYRAADVLLQAANADNYPCVVLEALACGTPVIGTAVGGIAEQISDQHTGFLVPRGDGDAMAQRLTLLLNDRDQLRRMAQAAAQTAAQTHRLEQQAQTYLHWFDQLQAEYHSLATDCEPVIHTSERP